MKKTGIFILTFALVLMTSSAWSGKLPETRVVKINERVYALLGPAELPDKTNRGYMSNSTLIIGDTGAILVDTGFSDEIGRQLKSTIAKITTKLVTHIFNTHDHGDHILGNSAFKDAHIYSSAQCQLTMEKSGYEWIGLLEAMTKSSFPNTRPVISGTTYAENTHTTITVQGVNLDVWVPKGSHTANDLMLYLPDDKVLIAGDILVSEITPSFRDAYVKHWIVTLDKIRKMQINTIVPGHGGLMNLNDVANMHDNMAKLYAGIEHGYKRGLMDSEIRKQLDLSEWKKYNYFKELMGTNISRTYLEVEAENF